MCFKTPQQISSSYIYICVCIICSQIQLIIGLSVLNVGKYCIIFYCPSAVVSSWRCYTVMTHLKIYTCIFLWTSFETNPQRAKLLNLTRLCILKKYTCSHLPKATVFKQQKGIIFPCIVPNKHKLFKSDDHGAQFLLF